MQPFHFSDGIRPQLSVLRTFTTEKQNIMKSVINNSDNAKNTIKKIARTGAIALFVVSSISAFSQNGKNKGFIDTREQAEGWYLPVFGQVFEEGAKCEGASVKVYIDNDELGTFPVTKKGSFRLELDLNKYYTIEVSKDGYVTKRIALNTAIGDDIVNYPAYDCFVNLTTVSGLNGADMDYFDFPAAIVRYDSKMGGFYHNDHYLTHIGDKMDQAIQQASR